MLMRRRLSDTLEIEVSSWDSSRGAEVGSSVRARRRVSTLPRQHPLQGTRHGALGKECERLQGDFMGGLLVVLKEEEEELKEADLEMVRYRRQARVEGAYFDVGLPAESM